LEHDAQWAFNQEDGMNVRGAAMLLVMLAGVVMICAPGYAQEVNVVKWNAMVGWTSPGNKVSTIEGVGTPWFMTDGSAEVHLATGHVKFTVKGLVLANSLPLVVGGTIGVVQEVKGTLICDGRSNVSSEFVDTRSVPLDPRGNAMFVGEVSVPAACLTAPDKLAFVVRIAAASNSALIDRWNAMGMGRTP
jgi:hypothetical protein